MAFSFRIGTKWCHDFPKLARESGFYFNMHKSRIRVDWNRMSHIDIDRIIRERDFYTVDDNVNNVIDYCLESEYDLKILDPNFVKLFRLAQLAVEYLLYCKQYLDHSVVILKDELRLKIEENVKLKKETATLEEVIKHLKEKAKEKVKWVETKIGDSSGEIYKCPHCPKTFMSSMYVSAHILRRHAYASDLYMTSSPIHEHYRSETEKLHNEIKNLKERLNETERVLRNEPEKVLETKTTKHDKKSLENEVKSSKYDTNKSEEHQETKGYQEEINNLKTMLFDEIHNLKQKERTMYERTSETNVQTLINQQEKEFQKLRNQLLEKLNPDIENMHAKLYTQENYWRSKIEQLEEQHQKDVERLTTQLKLTQKAADDMKVEYVSKVNNLEQQTATQSSILLEQSKQLHSLSHEISVSHLSEKVRSPENNLVKQSGQPIMLEQSNGRIYEVPNEETHVDTKIKQIMVENVDNVLCPNSSSKVFPVIQQNKSVKTVHTLAFGNKAITRNDNKSDKQKDTKIVKNTKFENKTVMGKHLKSYSSSGTSESEDSPSEKGINHQAKHIKYALKDQSTTVTYLNNSGKTELENVSTKNVSKGFLPNMKNSKHSEDLQNDLFCGTDSESVTSDSHTQSETESITTIHNSPVNDHKIHSIFLQKSKKATKNNLFYKRLQINLQNAFEQKLRDLGIDPEWQGIPKATFKQKMDILKHQQKITMKKSPKYHQIKLKVIEEVLDRISKTGKIRENSKHVKKSPLRKAASDVNTGTMKTFNDKQNFVQIQDTVPKKLYSTPEVDYSLSNIDESESTSITPRKITSYKSIEDFIKMSPKSIKSFEDTQDDANSYESHTRNDSSNQQKSVFDSEKYKIISNTKNILDTKLFKNDSVDNPNVQKEVKTVLEFSKHNKSVLKATSGSTTSLTKKKVIFDLANEKDRKSSSDYDVRKKKLNYSNQDTSSPSDERKHLPETENYKSTNNIILKTAQSDKIAEISRKLEAQLSMVRQKPVGSIETIFSSKVMQDEESQNNENQQASSTSISSILESPFRLTTLNTKVTANSVPQPAPRNLKDKIPEILNAESISEVSDLDSDIDKILKSD